MRTAIAFAVKGLGGRKALLAWAEDNETLFWTKIFPLIVPKAVELSGADGEALPSTIVIIGQGAEGVVPPARQALNGKAHGETGS